MLKVLTPLGQHAYYVASEIGRVYALNDREVDMVALVARGARVPMIARTLYLSAGTVRNLLSVIFVKLGVQGQTELVELIMATDLQMHHADALRQEAGR